MGKPKRDVRRGKGRGWGRRPKRVRKAEHVTELVKMRIKRAHGFAPTDPMPHVVGRGRWVGMRDSAPELNGPVRVRKHASAG